MERKKSLPGQESAEPLRIDTKAVHQLVLQFEKEFAGILLPADGQQKQDAKLPQIYYPHLTVEIPILPYSAWVIHCTANKDTLTPEVIKKIDGFLRKFSLLQCVGLVLAPQERSHEHSIGNKPYQQYMAFIRDDGKNPFLDFRVYNVPAELTGAAWRKETEYASCMMLNYWRSLYNHTYSIEKGLSYNHDEQKFFQLIRPSLSSNDWRAFEQDRFSFMQKYVRKNLCDKPVNFLTTRK